MAKKCNTDLGEAWVSTIASSLDGAFTVTNEDAAGNFEGIHSGDKIRGVCTGTHISYRRPTTRPVFEYSGKFNPAKNKIKGKRSAVQRDGNRLTEDEEWEGVKTTTLVNTKPSRRSKGGNR
jgi:hypothetical protein